MTAARTVQFNLGGTLRILLDEPETRSGAFVTVRYDGFSITARGNDMSYTLPDDHAVQVQVSYVDAKGHPASIDGDVKWQSSNETIAKVNADSGDSTIALVVPGEQLGQVQITAVADADVGEGVENLVTLMDVEIVGGKAVAGTISPVGEATPIGPEHRG